MTPRCKAHPWGYNGQSPGPTIEVARRPGTFMYHPHAD
jgi:FtsP/CotA-like multicopper oxidase with cupredoxin domain